MTNTDSTTTDQTTISSTNLVNIRFGEAIKEIREDKGLSIDELASKIDMDSTVIEKWENGSTLPSGSSMIRLSEALIGNRIVLGNYLEEIQKGVSKTNQEQIHTDKFLQYISQELGMLHRQILKSDDNLIGGSGCNVLRDIDAVIEAFKRMSEHTSNSPEVEFRATKKSSNPISVEFSTKGGKWLYKYSRQATTNSIFDEAILETYVKPLYQGKFNFLKK